MCSDTQKSGRTDSHRAPATNSGAPSVSDSVGLFLSLYTLHVVNTNGVGMIVM